MSKRKQKQRIQNLRAGKSKANMNKVNVKRIFE